MLRFFFFVMAYLTDYRAAADALRSGVTLGLADAALLCLVGAWLAVRGLRMSRGQQDSKAAAPATASKALE